MGAPRDTRDPQFRPPWLLIFPQAFRKLKLSQNDTYVRAQWKGNIGNFSSLFIGINQKCNLSA